MNFLAKCDEKRDNKFKGTFVKQKKKNAKINKKESDKKILIGKGKRIRERILEQNY